MAHQHHSYLSRGRYAEQLERWLDYVERERLLVLSAEELFEEPLKVVSEAQDFLGLGPRRPPTWRPGTLAPTRRSRPRSAPASSAEFEPHNHRLYQLLGRDFGWD